MNKNEPKETVNLLRKLLNEMVAHPEHMEIETRSLTSSVTISIKAHVADTPRLIGEGASNYRALLVIASAIGHQRGIRVTVPPIREPTVGIPARYQFKARADWPKQRLLGLLREIVSACFSRPEEILFEEDNDEANGITTIEVFVSRTESGELVQLLAPALRKIFDAIGRASGRLLAVDILVNTDPAQPETADGRHSNQP